MKGLTLANDVVNGDFADGTTGWSLSGGATVTGEELSIPAGSSTATKELNFYQTKKTHQITQQSRKYKMQ